MLHKTVIALAAVASLGTAALASSAAKAGPRHHPRVHAGHARVHVAPRPHVHVYRHVRRPAVRLPYIAGAPVVVRNECVRYRQVPTAFGWEWQRIWICG